MRPEGWVAGVVTAAALSACAMPTPLVPEATGAGGPAASAQEPAGGAAPPEGRLRVAYPDVPSAWVAADGDDPAALDLAALWGLPLFRIDSYGQLRRGLVRDITQETTATGLSVELTLAEGAWSDGRPVSAADVVATVEAVRDSARGAALEPLVAVEAADERRVVLRFDRPYARWPWMLSDVGGVLPAHVLSDDGLEAYSDDIPVSGGWFRLVTDEPGHRAVFRAHPDGPLGPPALAEIEVLYTPRFETALGLLRDGRAEVVMGHLALNPVERSVAIDDVTAAAPLGGTWVGLGWRRDGPWGAPTAAPSRRAVAAGVDVDELVEGLLGEFGAAAGSPVPGVDGPFRDVTDSSEPPAVTVAVPRWHEAVGFTARAVQRDIENDGGQLELVTLGTPDFVVDTRTERDAALRIHRDPPRPSLVPYSDGDTRAAALAADAAPAVEPGMLEPLAERAYVLPLYRIGVAHAWRGVSGVTPSSWPGLAFWDAGRWQLDDARGVAGSPPAWLPSSIRGRSSADHARVAELADAHG